MIELNILDNITVEVISGKDIVKKALSYQAEIFLPGKYGKRVKKIDKTFLMGKYFYAGFINQIKEYAQNLKIPIKINGSLEKLVPTAKPDLSQLGLRDYQIDIINEVIEKQRGIINAATRSGKSYIAVGIAKHFKNPKLLFLAPGIDILN